MSGNSVIQNQSNTGNPHDLRHRHRRLRGDTRLLRLVLPVPGLQAELVAVRSAGRSLFALPFCGRALRVPRVERP